jgi:hypothetical protein
VTTQNVVFWIVTLYNQVYYQRFGRTCFLHFQGPTGWGYGHVHKQGNVNGDHSEPQEGERRLSPVRANKNGGPYPHLTHSDCTDGGSMFLRNVGKLHGVTTQKTAIRIFTGVKISVLCCVHVWVVGYLTMLFQRRDKSMMRIYKAEIMSFCAGSGMRKPKKRIKSFIRISSNEFKFRTRYPPDTRT